MGYGVPDYQSFLRGELARRCERNPRYSLRAFCRSLSMDPGAMSRILAGKQPLSLKAAHKISAQLDLTPLERQSFLRSVVEGRGRREAEENLEPMSTSIPVRELDLDVFRVVSELYHFAIVELTETESFDAAPSSIAKRLGITSLQASLGLERLVRVGLLEKKGKGYRRTASHFSVKDKTITGPALIRLQKDILNRATSALDEIPVEKRVSNTISMAIDPDKLEMARDLIIEFSRALCQTLEKGKRKKVYQLSVNLFPLERET